MKSQNLKSTQTSQNNKQRQRRSSNSEKLDRLIDALEKNESDDPFENLTSSLQSAYANFGVFDSMTLSNHTKLRANDLEGEDMMIEDDDDKTMTEEQDDEIIDFAWKEFDSGWEKIMSKTPTTSSAHRRSGLRRGQNDATFAITVPTKGGNGAQPRTMLAGNNILSSCNETFTQSRPPAA